MSSEPAVSIVVATHNMGRELAVFLESLRSSTRGDFEVCVCDDASDDGTAEVISSFKNILDIRRTANETNRGVTFSRNAAAAMARSPLLLFMDADIRVRADTIEKLVESLESRGADVVEGIYSAVALDDDFFSRYYALFVHHSFRIGDQPVEYNVFNAWCALVKKEVWEKTGGHGIVARGVEVENETLGRRIVANGFTLLLDPSIAVDHHWGGHRKLIFIFTNRVYWWVKVFFSSGCKFESSLTTPGYGFATLCLPGALASALLAPYHPAFWPAAAVLLAGFFAGYGSFYSFARKERGLAYCAVALGLSMYFGLFAAFSAIYSGFEEVIKRTFSGAYTLDPEMFKT